MAKEVQVLTKKQQKALLKQLQSARLETDVEKAVERAVINMLEAYFSNHDDYGEVTTTYDFKTDGIIQATGEGLFGTSSGEALTILLEAKRNKNFAENKKDVLTVVAQAISYLHTIKNNDPHKYPQVVAFADNNEIFLIPAIALKSYVDGDYDWSLAASEQYKDSALMSDLAEDKNIRPVINDIDQNFNVVEFCNRIAVLADEAGYEKIKIGKSSLTDAFENFRKMVYGTNDPNVIQDENRQQIELFCRTLFGDEEVYAHPKKKNVLVIDGEEYSNMNSEGYEIFASRYDANGYSLKEYMDITEMADTLIAEANRRFKGDYYTPKVWVDKAHEVITDALGADWKSKYVVWDPAAGTKNLTREYMFSDLYSSTLYEGELMSTQHFNKDNVAFQYDFLNDDMMLHDGSLTLEDLKQMSDEELDEALKMDVKLVKKLINKEPVVFFGNPPYGQATTSQASQKSHKAGVGDTGVGKLMNNLGWGKKELYTQFYYRVQLIKNFFEYGEDDEFHIFFFSKVFLSSANFGKFVDKFTKDFSFRNGFMINGGEFDGTSAAWGLIFSHWSLNGDKNQKEFPFEVLKSTSNGSIEAITEWTAKRGNKKNDIQQWLRDAGITDKKDPFLPRTKNGWEEPDTKITYKEPVSDQIGCILSTSPTIQKAEKYLSLFTMTYEGAGAYAVTADNFDRASISFSIRRSVQEYFKSNKQLWIRDKDIFTKPSSDLLTDEFIADCVVYSLFDTQSNQTSLRQYEYKQNTYRVINEFFPFSKDFIEKLAIKHNNMDIQADLIGDTERFVYNWLEEHEDNLSVEAKALLAKAKELFEITFEYRDEYAKNTPRYQTNSWDAGYAQIARLSFGNERINDEFLDFKQEFYNLRTALGDKIALAAFNDGVI